MIECIYNGSLTAVARLTERSTTFSTTSTNNTQNHKLKRTLCSCTPLSTIARTAWSLPVCARRLTHITSPIYLLTITRLLNRHQHDESKDAHTGLRAFRMRERMRTACCAPSRGRPLTTRLEAGMKPCSTCDVAGACQPGAGSAAPFP